MKPMNFIATTTLGGACTAAVFGNLEAIWLLNTTGAPELVSLVYSVILYGLIGGGIAFGAAIGAATLQAHLTQMLAICECVCVVRSVFVAGGCLEARGACPRL